MAYKKYILRNGKLYGPYIYESRRVNGKVISEYHGIDKKPINFRKYVFILLGVFLIAGSIYGLIFSRNRITSNVVFDMKADYKEGEILDGFFKISLAEGELIPADSKIVFENLGRRYEYNLKDIVSDTPVEGDFYVREKSISGNGLGYGISGKKVTYPPVQFALRIYSESSSEQETENTELPEEETENNQTDETEAIPEEIPEENPEDAEAAITGNIISGFFGNLFNIFQGIIRGKITGRATSEIFAEIQGEVSADTPFIYNLEEGQNAEIASSSNGINMKIENNVVTVTTEYSEESRGFGKDYIGDGRKIIDIDLLKLNLALGKGELKTELIYENEEILSSSIILEEGEIKVKKEIINDSFQAEFFVVAELTEQEKEALKGEFGNFSVARTAELFRDRIIIRHELGDRWIENSYDADIPERELNMLIEESRIRWLKDIAREILSEETFSEKLGEFQKIIPFDSAGF